jgi:hypothetical protein
MNKDTFEKLEKSFESGELAPARVTVCEIPEKICIKCERSYIRKAFSKRDYPMSYSAKR